MLIMTKNVSVQNCAEAHISSRQGNRTYYRTWHKPHYFPYCKPKLENTIHLDLHDPMLKFLRYIDTNVQSQGTKGVIKLVKSLKGKITDTWCNSDVLGLKMELLLSVYFLQKGDTFNVELRAVEGHTGKSTPHTGVSSPPVARVPCTSALHWDTSILRLHRPYIFLSTK